MPYEFYWDSRAASADLSYQIDRDNLTITASSNFIMNAASEYAGADASTVDTTKTAAAAAAAENAKAIVEEHASKSDYEKLAAYKDEICELVSYNFEAAESLDINTAGSNPFEIIYCFDGDPDTNIVCEGYSKAFMHLCNLSTFSGEVNCYVPTGTMDGGPHMWNIVTILGRNFLVDITNCDAGMVGNPDNIFLKGVTGSVQNGYTLDLSDIGQGKISYVYTDETIEDYGTGILTLTYLDYSDDLPAVGDASVPVDDHVIWANGGKNYKTAVVTPEIQATSWVNSKGKTQKTKLAWTTSLTAEAPLFDTAKHKVMTKSDKTVATASNGKITAKSGGETGEATAYVYVSDLGTMTSELHTVTVKNAPSSILLFDDAEKTDKKEALKKTNLIAGGEAIRVYITPTAKQGAVSDDCTYTISAKKNDGLVQFSEIKTDENGRLYFEVSALKVQKLGKVSKVSVAVACDQSGKKATLNVSIVAPVEAVGAEGEGAIAKKGDTAALALTFDVAGDSRLYTDKLQLVASASEPVVDSTGKKVTMTKSKEISAKLEKDGVTVTLKASKDVTAAQNVYVIVTDASTKLKTAHKIAEIGADGVITPVALS